MSNAMHVAELRTIAADGIRRFGENAVIRAIKARRWSRNDYENLLLTLFPQVHQGTMSFALAAGNCPNRWSGLREFLVHHAHEEMLHYQWILDDLKSIGYTGSDPRRLPPPPPTQAYIAFNFYNAHHLPPARLASSLVLEGLAANLEPADYLAILGGLGLTAQNFTFFLGHSNTDKGHIVELWDVIESFDLTEDEWAWVKHACRTAAVYYRQMYEHSLGRSEAAARELADA